MHHKVRQWQGLVVKKQPPSLKANPGLSKDLSREGLQEGSRGCDRFGWGMLDSNSDGSSTLVGRFF